MMLMGGMKIPMTDPWDWDEFTYYIDPIKIKSSWSSGA